MLIERNQKVASQTNSYDVRSLTDLAENLTTIFRQMNQTDNFKLLQSFLEQETIRNESISNRLTSQLEKLSRDVVDLKMSMHQNPSSTMMDIVDKKIHDRLKEVDSTIKDLQQLKKQVRHVF